MACPNKSPEAMISKEYNHLYQTSKWRKIRAQFLQSNPLCVMCLTDGHYTPATVCDHITPHKGNLEAFYRGPFQALCKTHHDGSKAKQEYRGVIIGGGADGMPKDPNHHWNT